MKAWLGLVVGLLLISAGVARAEGVESFLVGGVGFRVPAGFVVAQTGASRSVMLRFHLPDFGVVDDRTFAGVYPEDDRPVLTVEISDDVSVPVGQVWLDQEIAYSNDVAAACSNQCRNDYSSLGGAEYATFDDFSGPMPKTPPEGGWFRLFEYPNSKVAFAVCYFSRDGAPTDCEMRERIGNKLTILVKFPIEYLSEGVELLDGVNSRLDIFEERSGHIVVPGLIEGPAEPLCWKPDSGFDVDKNVPLKIGPETWHIPPAYAATFGLNQTQDLAYDSFHLWLKLPDLEPLQSTDPNPIVIAGPGNYISLLFSFDDRPWAHQGRLAWLVRNPSLLGPHVGKNAFFDYEEYQEFFESKDLLYDFGLQYISDDQKTDDTSFPPDSFDCDQYGGALNPLCTFRFNGYLKALSPSGLYAGHYAMQYSFSRDYFSQAMRINACVQKLYEEFRYDQAP